MQLDKLTQNLRGELIQPGDQHYDAARKLYNAMIDRDLGSLFGVLMSPT